MGYQLDDLIRRVVRDGVDVLQAVGIALAVVLILILARSLFVVPIVVAHRQAQVRGKERASDLRQALERIEARKFPSEGSRGAVRRFLQRRHADASFDAAEGIGWRGGAVLAWSGMRGAVTIAAAQSLPRDVAYRSGLVLIAFCDALVTLVGQGTTLPILIRRLGIQGDSEEQSRREVARLLGELRLSALGMLAGPGPRGHDGRPFAPRVVDSVREATVAVFTGYGSPHPRRSASRLAEEKLELERLVLEAQQATLWEARASGVYRSTSIDEVQRLLDTTATRFEGQPFS